MGDIFNVEIGKAIDGNKVDKVIGTFAYITRKENNNGLDGFIVYDMSYLNDKHPVITIGNETAEPFVQDWPFFTGTKVNILVPKVTVSRYSLLFIAQSLKVHKDKYSYAFTINSTRLKKQIIQLPIDENGQPDYIFMESFIRRIEQKLIHEYINHLSIKIRNTPPHKLLSLECVKWSSFFISDVAEIISGRDIYEDERVPGLTPYIGASAFNNGVTHFISNTNETKEAQCISVNRNGSVGYAFYHPYEALYSNDCRKIRPKVNNRYIAMFIAHQITVQRGKYNYGYKMGTERLKRQMIQLPVNESGQLDWEFMTEYMKSIEHKLLLSYLQSKA